MYARGATRFSIRRYTSASFQSCLDCFCSHLVRRVSRSAGEDAGLQKFVSALRVRHGKWFVLHESYLLTIEFEERCDIHLEFLRDHPNGGKATAGLVAVRLSDEQVTKLHGRIRI